MRIAFEGIKKGFSIFWGDSILLIVLNFICFLALLPALLFFSVTASETAVITSTLNIVLVLPFVFFLFALYAVLFDCRQNNVISLKSYFRYIRTTWKQALIFGLVNIVFALMVGWNLRFYAQFQTNWALVLQYVFLSISLIWSILQIIMLPLFPRLENPQFKLALRNSAAILASYWLPVLALLFWTGLLLVVTLAYQFLGMLATFVFIGAWGEGVIGEIVIDVKGPESASDIPEE